jgi:hypothetical protein
MLHPRFAFVFRLRTSSGLGESDVFGTRIFSLQDRDWFGNSRAESTTKKYIARLSGIQLSNCPYAEEKTLRDVLCKCPNLFQSSMQNCSFGGSLKSKSVDAQLRVHYLRGDESGRRGAPSDDFHKGSAALFH